MRLPPEVRSLLRERLAECRVARAPNGPVDFAMVFATSSEALQREFESAARRRAPGGLLWAVWPKKGSGWESDLNDEKVRAIGLATGLVDVKVGSVTNVWSGLKFVRRLVDRSSGRRPKGSGRPTGRRS
ncbi:MAG: DUF3052 domain-containing protein [Thermoplasmata archaeon]